MNKVFSRVLALFLSASMILGTAPVISAESNSDLSDPVKDSNVSTVQELRKALKNKDIPEILLTDNIKGIDSSIEVRREVTIDGGGHTLSFTGLENAEGNIDDGLILYKKAIVQDITIDAALQDPTKWVGTYAIQVYNNDEGATLTDVTVKNANAGILVNSSNVTLSGTIDVSDNGFGGIELSNGTPSLDASDATITNESEELGLPTIWVDGTSDIDKDAVQFNPEDGAFTVLPINSDKKQQVHYYLNSLGTVTLNTDDNIKSASVTYKEDSKVYSESNIVIKDSSNPVDVTDSIPEGSELQVTAELADAVQATHKIKVTVSDEEIDFNEESGAFTFTMPAENVEITVSAEEKQTPPQPGATGSVLIKTNEKSLLGEKVTVTYADGKNAGKPVGTEKVLPGTLLNATLELTSVTDNHLQYYSKTVTVTGNNKNTIATGTEGTLAFKMPESGDVTVSAKVSAQAVDGKFPVKVEEIAGAYLIAYTGEKIKNNNFDKITYLPIGKEVLVNEDSKIFVELQRDKQQHVSGYSITGKNVTVNAMESSQFTALNNLTRDGFELTAPTTITGEVEYVKSTDADEPYEEYSVEVEQTTYKGPVAKGTKVADLTLWFWDGENDDVKLSNPVFRFANVTDEESEYNSYYNSKFELKDNALYAKEALEEGESYPILLAATYQGKDVAFYGDDALTTEESVSFAYPSITFMFDEINSNSWSQIRFARQTSRTAISNAFIQENAPVVSMYGENHEVEWYKSHNKNKVDLKSFDPKTNDVTSVRLYGKFAYYTPKALPMDKPDPIDPKPVYPDSDFAVTVQNGSNVKSVTFTDGNNQSITNLTKIPAGTKLNATVHLNDGLALDKYNITLTVKAGNNTIKSTKYANVFTFTMPEADITVSASASRKSSGGSSGSGSSSSNKSSKTTTPSTGTGTVTTTNVVGGGTNTVVSAQPESVAVTTGTAQVTTTIANNAASVIAAATAEKPAKVDISLPISTLIQQLQNSEVKTAALTIKAPAAIANNTNPNATINIALDSSLLNAAKVAGKALGISVQDSTTGKLAYTWSFDGTALAQADAATLKTLNLAISVQPSKNVPVVNSAASGKEGVSLRFASNGTLPTPATVKVDVSAQGYTAGQALYFYYLNPTTSRLELQNNGQPITVDAQGYASVTVSHNSDFVLLPSKINGGSLTLDTRSYTMAKGNSYEIGTKLVSENVALKVTPSRTGIAKVEKLKNGNYKVTALKNGTTYVSFDAFDANGNLLGHASVKITVQNGKAQGVSGRQTLAF